MKNKLKTFFLMMIGLLTIGSTACNPADNQSSNGGGGGNYPSYDEDSVAVHYYRKDGKYDNWALWFWAGTNEGKEYSFNGSDSYGAVAAYPLSELGADLDTPLGFIVKSKGSWTSKDPDGDRFIDFKKFEKDENDIYHVYLQSGDKGIYSSPDLKVVPEISMASFASYTSVRVVTNVNVTDAKLFENNVEIVHETYTDSKKDFRLNLPDGKEASFDNSYKVELIFEDETKLESIVSVSTLYKSRDFENEYNYDGELGAIYTKQSTEFKVWSPVSKEIKVRIYDNGTPTSVNKSLGNDKYVEYNLVKGDKGVFSTKVSGDLQGKYYTYVVTNATYIAKEVVDPYARSAGVNGLRGMIVDFDLTNPDGWNEIRAHQYDRKELTVYETHLVDITSSQTWGGTRGNEKTFKGAYETGTTYTKDGVTVKTGFDHIKELGVNAVQFIPIFDQSNDEVNKSFNWGYNPLNYNVLEGSYSSDPYNGYTRIKEFKELVKAYNEAGINIIMDVVYNHTSGAIGSNFDVIMPGYYYRYNGDGTLSNGSGCGNETASDMYMMQRFMIDSTTFWAKEYKLGGFRFDLMALHDLDTMAKLTEECQKINPAITIYGEPWTGGTTTLAADQMASQANGNRFVGYGQFNDQTRDALIKGGMNAASAKGWVTNTTSVSSDDLTKIQHGVRGTTFVSGNNIADPNKTVNYVTCHDNYTLYDRIKAAGISDANTIKQMAMLANSVVFTTEGTTFMLAGEEFLRTKGGNSNSYDAPYSVNELDYELKVDNIDMFHNYQKLIALKQNLDGLHSDKGTSILNYHTSENQNQIIYNVTDTANNRDYLIVHANGYNPNALETIDFEGYTLYLDTLNRTDLVLSNQTVIKPFETIIAYKSL